VSAGGASRPPQRGGAPPRAPASPRGQAHALEGIVASLVVLSAVVFALEMTAVTPLSASTSSQHIENQQEATARGVLAAGAKSGALKRTLLYWNDSSATGGHFWDARDVSDSGYYTSGAPPTEFGAMLERSFDSNGIAYNIRLRFDGEDGPRTTTWLVNQGFPSDNAVRATWPVVLYQNDKIHDENENPTGTNVSAESTFYAPNGSDSSVHNVVRVEVVVWRI
jgi:hypothetical protein